MLQGVARTTATIFQRPAQYENRGGEGEGFEPDAWRGLELIGCGTSTCQSHRQVSRCSQRDSQRRVRRQPRRHGRDEYPIARRAAVVRIGPVLAGFNVAPGTHYEFRRLRWDATDRCTIEKATRRRSGQPAARWDDGLFGKWNFFEARSRINRRHRPHDDPPERRRNRSNDTYYRTGHGLALAVPSNCAGEK